MQEWQIACSVFSRHLVAFTKRLSLAAIHSFTQTTPWPWPTTAAVMATSRSPTTPLSYTSRRDRKFSASKKCPVIVCLFSKRKKNTSASEDWRSFRYNPLFGDNHGNYFIFQKCLTLCYLECKFFQYIKQPYVNHSKREKH